MPKGTDSPRQTIAWLRPDQAGFVARLAEHAGLEIIGAGCPEKGRAGSVAAELGCPPADDLPATLTSAETDLVLIADPGSFGASGAGRDSAALLSARSRGVRVATLEPIPAAALDLTAGGWARAVQAVRPVDALRFLPLARHGALFTSTTEMREHFGRAGTMVVESFGRPEHGSLGARLFAALDLVHAVMGEADTVDAAYVGTAGDAMHTLPGETLRGLHGDLTANLRFPGGRAACIAASDRAGAWWWRAELIGAAGRLRLEPTGAIWTPAAGGEPDRFVHEAAAGAGIDLAEHEFTASLTALLDPASQAAPIAHEPVLSMSQAALLSARTGQAESPAVIGRLVAKVS